MKKWNLILSVMLVIALIITLFEVGNLKNEVGQLNKELKIINEKLASSEGKDFDFMKIYAEAKKAVVVVAGGTGFLFIKRNQVVTNFHVIKSLIDETIEILPNDDVHLLVRGKIKLIKPEWDLAIIELDEHLNAEPLMPADITSLAVGEKILVVGNPDGSKNSLSAGIISALAVKRSLLSIPLIQIDATLNRGSSGSPVINKNGEVIGTISNSMDNFSFGFAVPMNKILQLLSE